MPVSEVVARFGTAGLARLVGALSLFLLLHLLRAPLLVALRVMGAAMARVDAYAARQVSHRPRSGWQAAAA